MHFAFLGLLLVIMMIILMVYVANGGYLKSMKKLWQEKALRNWKESVPNLIPVLISTRI